MTIFTIPPDTYVTLPTGLKWADRLVATSAKYKVGQRVFIGGHEATIVKVIEPDLFAWGGASEHEYELSFSSPNTGYTINVFMERALTPAEATSGSWWHGPKCECGVDSVRSGGRHSSWCPKASND